MSDEASRPCVLNAWELNERELRGWLVRQVRGDQALADDLLQTVFLKALREGPRFCGVDRPRSWLFATARNAVVDHFRLLKREIPLPEDLSDDAVLPPPVDSLARCLPRALDELSELDADVLRRCDLEGVNLGTGSWRKPPPAPRASKGSEVYVGRGDRGRVIDSRGFLDSRRRPIVGARRVALVVWLELGGSTAEMARVPHISPGAASRLLSRPHDADRVRKTADAVSREPGVRT